MPNDASDKVANGSVHIQLGRWTVDISSGQLLTVLTVIGLFALIGGAGYLHVLFISDVKAEHSVFRQDHAYMSNQLEEKLEVMIYLLSRPDDKRPELVIPHGLQQRLVPR